MNLFRAMALLGVFLVAGCGAQTPRPIRYDLPQIAGGRLCVMQCRNAKEHCEETCSLSERACYQEIQGQAIKDYEAYVRTQFMAHQPVDLRPSDFERTTNCNDSKQACQSHCQYDYDDCFVACGGRIVREGSCEPFCSYKEYK